MYNSTSHHDPLLCVLPPYILERIASRGNRVDAEVAAKTLNSDIAFRSARLVTVSTTTTTPPPVQRPSATMRAAAMPAAGIAPLRRTIYTANNTETLPGNIVRNEGGSDTGDPATDEAYDGLGATHSFFADIFNRNSLDNNGSPLTATVHYGTDYVNAFWNGTQMVFGDGDGSLFNRFTIALDIIAHELTHGVTGSQIRLATFFQPGALNEHISDAFGSMVKQRKRNQTSADADWLIGEGLLTDAVNGVALRSMKDPGTAYDDPVLGKDPQPKHMRDLVHTIQDHGGVHINCGIPNYAFYLLATNLGGNSWDKAGPIWYETLTDSRLSHHISFMGFAQLTLSSAIRLYGSRSVEAQAVIDAWDAVGINAQ